MRFMKAAAVAAALTLGACGADNPAGNDIEAEAGTLADAIAPDSAFGQAMAAAGLDGILDGPTPYTLLVPSDDALAAMTLPDASDEEGREALAATLSNHIMPGTILSDDIGNAVSAGDGEATLPSLGEATLTARRDGEALTIDAGSNVVTVTAADARYDNGVVHRLDGLL